jgi:hypothetical protein
LVAELGRVNKDTDGYRQVVCPRLINQAEVPGMQSAHGWHQANRFHGLATSLGHFIIGGDYPHTLRYRLRHFDSPGYRIGAYSGLIRIC